MTPHRALIEAAEAVLPHLEYKRTHTQTAEGRKNVARAIESLKAAISSAKAAEGVETIEQAWKRAYLAGALHVSNDFGVELCGLAIEEYSAPKAISVREKEGL